MNKPLIKSIIAKNDDTQDALAEALNMPRSSLSMRINGKTDFRASEINCIRKRYKLTQKELIDIFFDSAVS